MVACAGTLLLSKYFCVILGSPSERLLNQAYDRVIKALGPQTRAVYLSKFKLFLAFLFWRSWNFGSTWFFSSPFDQLHFSHASFLQDL